MRSWLGASLAEAELSLISMCANQAFAFGCMKGPPVKQRIVVSVDRHVDSTVGQAALQAQKNKLAHLDRMSFVDIQYMAHARGDAGRKRLEEAFMNECLCTSVKHITVDEALQKATKLIEGDLYKFVGGAAQGVINAAHNLLVQIQGGRAPAVVPEPTPFLASVWAKLPAFYRTKMQQTSDASNSNDGYLVGTAALQAHFEAMKSAGVDSVQLADFVPLEVYAPFLDVSLVRELSAMKASVLKGARKKAGSAKLKAEPKHKRKAKDAELDADAAAAALLGLS